MAKYVVEITEILQKEMTVKANSYEQARKIIKDMYNHEEIVLNETDYMNTEINVLKTI